MRYLICTILVIFLFSTTANAQGKQTLTREQAIIHLDETIGNTTTFDLGKWIIGHIEVYSKEHGSMAIAGSDLYIFEVAKSKSYIAENYQCALIIATYRNRISNYTNSLQGIICVDKEIVVLETKANLALEQI